MDFKKIVRSKQNKKVFTDGEVSKNILGILISVGSFEVTQTL